MEWEPIQLISSLDSLALSPVTSSEIFSANGVGVVTLGKTSGFPLTVSPPPDPAPTSTSSPTTTDPAPAPTVTVTQTVAPPGPSEISGTVTLDGVQYLGLTSGLVLLLVFVVAGFVAQLRRP